MEAFLKKQAERNKRSSKRNRKLVDKYYTGKSIPVKGRQSYDFYKELEAHA